MAKVRDIIVGGAGDRLFGCARRYADALAQDHPERDVVYLPQGRRRTLIGLIEDDRTTHLIGHSWGAADMAWALGRARPRGLGAVIAVDPVGKPLRRGCAASTAHTLIHIRATGSEGRLSDGNLTALIGRWIGRACPPGLDGPRALQIDAPFAHYDMTRMMRHPGPDGRSAQDWLLAGESASPPTESPCPLPAFTGNRGDDQGRARRP